MFIFVNRKIHGNEVRMKIWTVYFDSIIQIGTDLSVYSQTNLNKVARQLNELLERR